MCFRPSHVNRQGNLGALEKAKSPAAPKPTAIAERTGCPTPKTPVYGCMRQKAQSDDSITPPYVCLGSL